MADKGKFEVKKIDKLTKGKKRVSLTVFCDMSTYYKLSSRVVILVLTQYY